MRLAALLAIALAPAALAAQGRIIPRPCAPPPCPPEARCAPPPCVRPGQPWVERTGSEVKVELADRVLRYQITERFVNRGPAVAEADYVFPMPKGAAFQDLKLSIDGELVSGETMTAEKARAIYEEIVRRQRDPALVEWMGAGMLRTRIFPIAPGEEKTVVVRFDAVAEREGDALRVDYRRGTAPRSGGVPVRPTRVVDDARIDARDDEGGRESGHSFTLTIPEGPALGEPYSPTHALRVSRRNGRRVVSARGDGPEVTILLPIRRRERASIAVLPHRPDRDDGFALITVTPPVIDAPPTPRDLTLVLDVSGSMRGTKMEQARRASLQLLETLSPADRFRLVAFSTDVDPFRDGFSPATESNLAAARRWLNALKAEGSTNISGALEDALADRRATNADRLPLVLFLTDGEPTVGERSPEGIAGVASRLRGERRIFTFGVGADVNAALVERLAVEGRGTAHFVRPEENVERAVGLVASRLQRPVLTDVRVRADGVRLVRMHPSLPSDVFAGQDLVVLARYDGEGRARVRIEAQSAAGPVSTTTEVSFPERERDNSFVARLWATQRVGWLSAERRRRGATSELDDELRQLGMRYGIPTELTSYLVLEPGMRDAAGGIAGAASGRGAAQPEAARRGRIGDSGPVRLDEVVVASAGTAAAPAPVAPQSREQRFEAAKTAATMREATSLAAADSAMAASSADERAGGAAGNAGARRRVGERIFSLAGGVWRDLRHDGSKRVVRVRPFSPAYFELLKQIPELAEPFALGERVLVAGRGVSVETAADAPERLDASQLAAIVRAW